MDRKEQLDFFDLKLAEKIGNLFEYAVFHEGYSIYYFTLYWLASNTFQLLLDWDISLVSQAHTYIFGKFEEEMKKTGIIIEKEECIEYQECVNWVGYVTMYWCIWEGISGKDIINRYDITHIVNNSEVYHSLGVKTAISMIKEDGFLNEQSTVISCIGSSHMQSDA